MGSTFGGAFAGGNVYGFMYNSDTNDTRFYIMNADTHQVAYPGTSAGRVVVAMHTTMQKAKCTLSQQTMQTVVPSTP